MIKSFYLQADNDGVGARRLFCHCDGFRACNLCAIWGSAVMDGVEEGRQREREREQKELIWLQLCLSMIVCFSFELILNTLSTRLAAPKSISQFIFLQTKSLFIALVFCTD